MKTKSELILTKDYFQKYAQLVLPSCGFNGNFIIDDKPDLQSIEESIGIEVSCAMSVYEGKLMNVLNECIIKELTYDEVLKNRKIQSLGIQNEFIQLGEQWGLFYNPDDSVNTSIQAQRAIKKKIAKFPHYKKFRDNGLLLFISPMYLDHYLIASIDKYFNDIIDNPFSFLILNLGYKIYVLRNHTQKCYDISEYEMDDIKKQSLDYEKEINYTDPYRNA